MIKFLTLSFMMVSTGQTGKVLFLPAMVSPSHKFALATLADALSDRNHDVHWWAPSAKLDTYQPKKVTNVHHFAVDIDDQMLLDLCKYENETSFAKMDWINDYANPFLEVEFSYVVNPFCEEILKSHHRRSFDELVEQSWDLIVIDELFSSCGYLIAQLVKAPVITYVSTCRRTSEAILRNRDTVPLAYVPGFRSMWTLKDRKSFSQRLIATISWIIGSYGDRYYYDLMTDQLSPYIPDMKHMSVGLDRPDFQFVCTPQNLDYPTPTMPNVINIGGIYKPSTSQSLPEEYANLVNSAPKGFILVTMGHWTHWEFAPERILKSFVDGFNKLAQDGYVVFWQYNGHPIENLSNNVKAQKWLPQKSLLAHPKCKLFVTHCGCNGLIEAIQNAVPMVAVPLTADQPGNADMMAARRFGVVENKNELTSESFHNALTTVLNDESFRTNIKKFSLIMENELINSLDRSVFWSEYSMRHKNRNPYKSPSIFSKLSWIQYHSIDIALVLILVIFSALFIFATAIFAIVIIMKQFRDNTRDKRIPVKKYKKI